MKKITYSIKFDYGQEVYYLTGDKGKGVVLDARHNARYMFLEYFVTFGLDSNYWISEAELRTEPNPV